MNPKFLYLKLAENNAAMHEVTDEGFSIRTASGRILGQIRSPRSMRAFVSDDASKVSKADSAVQHALNGLCQFDSAILRINRDERLTSEGKREPAATASKAAIKTLTWANREMSNYAADARNMAINHYAVPELNPADPKYMMRLLHEQEIRNWIYSLGDKATVKLVGPLQDGTNDLLSLAILRSPVPLDSLSEHAQAGWHAARDKADPETAQLIATCEELSGWANAWVTVVANAVRRTALPLVKDFNSLVPDEGRELFAAAA
jgi:hypothetical protein